MLRNLGRVNKRNEDGLTSIVIVGILIVLLTLISVGFARIMDRTVRNSLNDQTATAANYAAQSGINDLATFARSNPNAVANKCNDLIGTPSQRGPFYNTSNLSGENAPPGQRNSEYTCVLLNQRPDKLYYQQIPAQQSKVIKMTTDTTPGSLNEIMLSWQSVDTGKKQLPNAAFNGTLPDVATWNENNYVPMLRVTIYPIPLSGAIADVQANSKTLFLYPEDPSQGGVNWIPFSSLQNGGVQRVGCSKPNEIQGIKPNMDCNLVITNLVEIPNVDYFYLRIMPIYNNLDIEIQAQDVDDRTAKFLKVQAVLDVTAKVGPASKRLQARADIGGVSTDSSGNPVLEPSPNVGPDDDAIPEYSLRSAATICKRVLLNDSYYDYISIDSNSPSCGWGNTDKIDTPSPLINYFRINGINDFANTQSGGSCPPTLPASGASSGCYYGTYYIDTGVSANLTWQSVDATRCDASSSPARGEWNGDKAAEPGRMTWNQATRTGTGTQPPINGITTVTNFDLRCSGPGGTTPTRTVRAWPTPTVSISGPGSYRAGEGYTISFSSTNSSRCEMRSSGNKPWTQDYSGIQHSSGSSPGDSKPFGTSWDDQSGKSYTVTCYDPSNRSASATWTVGTGGSNTTILPPSCSADRGVNNNGNGTGTPWWRMSCPQVSPGSGNYRVESNIPGLGNADLASWMRDYNWSTVGPGTYCLRAIAGAPGWGTLADTGSQCYTIYATVTVNSFQALVWDQGPERCSNLVALEHRNTWRCRNNKDVVNLSNGCPDGVHRWTACASHIHWDATLSDGSKAGITCRGYSGYGEFPSTNGPTWANPTTYGWVDSGTPYPFKVECTGPGGDTDHLYWNPGNSR